MPQIGPVLRGLEVARPLEVRATDLYVTRGHVRDGVVLLGDAYHAPCPASGTGMTRILNDVDRLANVFIPRWMATPGMEASKIAAFYADPVKRRLDRRSVRRSMSGRAMAVSSHPYWRARRMVLGLRRTTSLRLASLLDGGDVITRPEKLAGAPCPTWRHPPTGSSNASSTTA